MELDEFVTMVLKSIVTAIRDAQAIEGVGAFVVPSRIGGHSYAKHPRVSVEARLSSTIIDFDIAVTAEDSTSTSGGGGLKVAGIGASLDGESSSSDKRVSRIQFAVPILLPESQQVWSEELQK